MTARPAKLPPGIRERHSRMCRIRLVGRCDCAPTIEAFVWDPTSQRKIRRSFSGKDARAAARQWRADALSAKGRGAFKAPVRRTLREEAEAWLELAESGALTTRAGTTYKPAVVRQFRSVLNRHVLPPLGARRLSDIQRRDVQELLDGMRAGGLSGSTCRNALVALKVIFRRALENDALTINPTANLRMPPPAGTRERVAAPAEVAELLKALPDSMRPIWATAAYGGLRLGELRALRWRHVNLEANVITVGASWDDRAGPVPPKSRKGVRSVPVTATLRRHLVEHKLRSGRDGDALVFGRSATLPFTPTHVRSQAKKAWEAENKKRAKKKLPPLAPIGLHELRHSYVSMMHAAGFTLEAIGDYVGHNSAWMTERYRHLLDGHEAEAAKRFEAYLAEATGARPGAQGSQ